MADFTPAEEVERISMAPLDMVEKAVRDFFREGWVEEPSMAMLKEDLVVALVVFVVITGLTVVEAAAEGTLVEAVEMITLSPVGEGEALTTQAQTSKTNVVTTQLVMATSTLHFCRRIKKRATTSILQL